MIHQKQTNNTKSPSTTKTDNHLQARNTKLLNVYQQWRGTPYRLGGSSPTGIDCSAFVQKVYLASFNMKLPRTTQSLPSSGKQIKQQQAVIGDLIFFKTNSTTRHVGVYLNDNQFLHASTSAGVIISDLDNIYWRKHYWQTRRLVSEDQ